VGVIGHGLEDIVKGALEPDEDAEETCEKHFGLTQLRRSNGLSVFKEI
jgi:hypothetical protein